MKVYLDNAATTPMDPEVMDTMLPLMRDQFGNPSSIHSYGRQSKAAIESARKTVARFLQASPSEIFFTSGGTEANNTALFCSVRDLGIKHIITSKIEHHAVLYSVEELEKEGKIRLSFVDLDEKGLINLENLEQLLRTEDKTLVTLMYANNELGNILPFAKVADLCEKYNAIFHCDTVQAMGHYPINLKEVPVHFVTCAAHKFHGPKGVGFLYINHKIRISPFLFGGAQERNMRGGTENVYGIAGLAKAFEIANLEMAEHEKHIRGLKKYMIQKLRENIPGVQFNGDTLGDSLYTVLNVAFPAGENSEMLLFNLDIAGICCSGGSACSSGSMTGSHVLKTLYGEVNRPSVRFSFSKYNTKEEIDYTVEKLKELIPVNVS